MATLIKDITLEASQAKALTLQKHADYIAAYGQNKDEYTMASNESDMCNQVGTKVNGLAVFVYSPWRQYVLASTKHLSNSTVAAIMDKVNKTWLLRVDNPHPGVPYSHLNINPALTGVRDPHTKMYGVPLFGAAQKIANIGSDWLPLIVTTATAARVAKAVHQDVTEDTFPKHTANMSTHMTGEVVGGLVGATVATKIGVVVGGLVMGVPGAAVASMAGGLAGGVYGAIKGKEIANSLDQDMVVQTSKLVGNASLNASIFLLNTAYSAAGITAAAITSSCAGGVNILKNMNAGADINVNLASKL